MIAALGDDERTVRKWAAESGRHCRDVQEELIEQPRVHEQIQADELRVKLQGRVVWVALAIWAVTRGWLGAEVEPSRTRSLFDRWAVRVPPGLCSWGTVAGDGGTQNLYQELLSGVS